MLLRFKKTKKLLLRCIGLLVVLIGPALIVLRSLFYLFYFLLFLKIIYYLVFILFLFFIFHFSFFIFHFSFFIFCLLFNLFLLPLDIGKIVLMIMNATTKKMMRFFLSHQSYPPIHYHSLLQVVSGCEQMPRCLVNTGSLPLLLSPLFCPLQKLTKISKQQVTSVLSSLTPMVTLYLTQAGMTNILAGASEHWEGFHWRLHPHTNKKLGLLGGGSCF